LTEMTKTRAPERVANRASRTRGPPPLRGTPGLLAVLGRAGNHAMAGARIQRKCACGGEDSSPCHCGNQGVQALLRTRAIQAKLRVNQPNDLYEQEAERVAEQVLAMPAHPAVSSAPPRIQRHTGEANSHAEAAPASVDQILASPGNPLDPALRQDMEQRFGYDFSRVRLHSGPAAEQSAREVDANAYTAGHDIVFGAGRFSPGTLEGRRLIAHELTHVVQQSGSAINTANIASLQRQRRGAAAGCGICMNDPRGSAAGDIAHTEVQEAFTAANPDIVPEREVPGLPGSGIDLSYERFQHGQHVMFIGEIKPLDDAGVQADIGREKLKDYAREMHLSQQYDEVFRMRDSPPRGPLFFENPMNPPGCPQQVINVQRTEPGLYQYYCEPPFSQLVRNPLCRCSLRREEPEPHDPPVIGDRPFEQRGDSESTSESKGKSNGQPGKGDGERKPGRPGRRPPAPGGPQPTLRLPGGIDWAAALAALLALLALTPWGRIGELLGTALGLLLRALGFSLGILAGTAAASAADSPSDPGGPPSGPPAGDPIPRTGPPARTTIPPAGTRPLPHRAPVPRVQKRPPAAGAAPLRAPATRRTIKMKLIEGLNLDTVSVGRTYWVVNYRTGDIVLLQVTNKVVEGKDTTVDFVSVLECSTGGCSSGGNGYTVTHPYRGPPDAPVYKGAASGSP
jgi:uncharacterized protein DUF4157